MSTQSLPTLTDQELLKSLQEGVRTHILNGGVQVAFRATLPSLFQRTCNRELTAWGSRFLLKYDQSALAAFLVASYLNRFPEYAWGWKVLGKCFEAWEDQWARACKQKAKCLSGVQDSDIEAIETLANESLTFFSGKILSDMVFLDHDLIVFL